MDTTSKDGGLPNALTREITTNDITPSTTQSKDFAPSSRLKSPVPETSTLTIITIVPKAKRRGLLGRLTLVPELENSKEYSRAIKWFITFTVSAGAAVITTVRS